MAETPLAQDVFTFPVPEASEQYVQKSEPNVEHYFSLGEALALQGDITKALDAYSRAIGSGDVPVHRLSTFVSILIERVRQNFELAETPAASTDLQNILTCQCCGSHWADPLTLKCGHTFCRMCVEHGIDDSEAGVCITCRCAVEKAYLSKCKTNIFLSHILRKCYPDEVAINELKVAANRLSAKKHFTEAIKAYTEVIRIAPNDLHLRNCRSYAYNTVGLYQDAVEDADLIIQLRPHWAQGYCRRAAALRGLSHLEESIQCYLRCLAIDPGLSLAKTELTKVLYELLSQSSFSSDDKLPAWLSLYVPIDCAAKLNTVNATSNSSPVGLSSVLRADEGRHERPGCVAGAAADPQHPRKRCLSFLFSRKKQTLKGSSCPVSNLFCRSSSLPRTTDRHAPDSVSDRTRLERLSAEDFECSLCSSLLFCPVTTDCGHVFCCDCLYRSLDYRVVCPLCKESLAEFLAERRQATTESVELIAKLCCCSQLKKRKKQREQELSLWSRNAVGDQPEIPVFVCVMAYPNIPCPLHVFEPRYRLLIRRCTESGLNQFGMCTRLSQSVENFADVGTLLLICNVKYMADGRSVVDTVGGRRFRVLSRGMLDGHHTARVAYVSDVAVPTNEVEDLHRLQIEVHTLSSNWFARLPKPAQCRVLQCYGHFPPPEPELPHLPNGPAWIWYMTAILPLGPQSQLKILSMLSLRERLLTIRHVLTCLCVNRST